MTIVKWDEIFPKIFKITKFDANCVEIERRFFFKTKEVLKFSNGEVTYSNFSNPNESFKRRLGADDSIVLAEGLPKKGGRWSSPTLR